MSVYGTQVHVYKRWWQLASDFAPEYGGGVALCLRSCLRLLNSEGLAATHVVNFPTPQFGTKNLKLNSVELIIYRKTCVCSET